MRLYPRFMPRNTDSGTAASAPSRNVATRSAVASCTAGRAAPSTFVMSDARRVNAGACGAGVAGALGAVTASTRMDVLPQSVAQSLRQLLAAFAGFEAQDRRAAEGLQIGEHALRRDAIRVCERGHVVHAAVLQQMRFVARADAVGEDVIRRVEDHDRIQTAGPPPQRVLPDTRG